MRYKAFFLFFDFYSLNFAISVKDHDRLDVWLVSNRLFLCGLCS